MFASVLFVLAVGLQQQNPAGQALIEESAVKLKPAKSMIFTMSTSVGGQTMTMKGKWMKGGYQQISTGQFEMITTPAGALMLLPETKQYMKQPVDEAQSQGFEALPGLEPVFENARPLIALGPPEPAKLGSKATLRVWTKVSGVEKSSASSTGKQYVHFDPETKFPAGAEYSDKGQNYVLIYEDLKLDAGLTAKDFEWTPPAGWRELTMNERPAPSQIDKTADLLNIGGKAPAFVLSTPSGGKASLAAAMKGKKATLVNFWSYGQVACRQELPHLRDLYGRLKKQGFGIILINVGDDAKTIRDFSKKSRLAFPIVMNHKGGPDVVRLYHVDTFPTNYLIDAKGKIIARFVGFDEEAMKKELRKAGFKL
jgi:peroxiredoxin/outer membrane lipoprotein-sorting protein